MVDPEDWGMSREELIEELESEGLDPKEFTEEELFEMSWQQFVLGGEFYFAINIGKKIGEVDDIENIDAPQPLVESIAANLSAQNPTMVVWVEMWPNTRHVSWGETVAVYQNGVLIAQDLSPYAEGSEDDRGADTGENTQTNKTGDEDYAHIEGVSKMDEVVQPVAAELLDLAASNIARLPEPCSRRERNFAIMNVVWDELFEEEDERVKLATSLAIERRLDALISLTTSPRFNKSPQASADVSVLLAAAAETPLLKVSGEYFFDEKFFLDLVRRMQADQCEN